MPHRTAGVNKVRALSATGVVVPLLATLFNFGCAKDKNSNDGEAGVRPVHTVTFSGEGADLAADGNLLALSARNQGIYVYDVSTPARPLEIAALDLPYVYRTIVQDKTIFGFDEQEGLSFVDLANINQLALTQALSTSELYGYVNDAAWVNNSLFFASESIGLSTYSVSAEFSLSGGKISTSNTSQPATSIALTANRLIAASFRGEINVFEQSEAAGSSLSPLNSLFARHRITDLACSESHCYAAALAEGLFVYSFAEAAKPELQYQLNFDDVIDLVHIDEDLLYASYRGPKGKNGWYVFDLSDAARPAMVRKIATGTEIKDFTSIGNITYVLLTDSQLLLYERGSLN